MEASRIKNIIEKTLDNNKANNIVSIDLKKKSYIADYMIVASGNSSRHIQALSEMLLEKLKKNGFEEVTQISTVVSRKFMNSAMSFERKKIK